MPVYVSKAGGVGLANVLTVEDLDLGFITVTGSVDTGSLIVSASFGNPFVTFSLGDGSELYVNLVTLVPNTASYVLSSSFAQTASFTVSSSFAQTSSFTLSSSFARTASYVNLLAGPNITINYQSNGIAISSSGGGGSGTPASPNKGIQYNNNGSFGASSNYLFDYDFSSVLHGAAVTASAPFSYAQGTTAKAYGTSSHAEGSKTNAFSSDDHAEGNLTFTGLFGFVARTGFSGSSPNEVALSSNYSDVTTTFPSNSIILINDGGSLTLANVSQSRWDGSNTFVEIVDDAISTSADTKIFLIDSGLPDTLVTLQDYQIRYSGFLAGIAASAKHSEGHNSIALGAFSHAEGQATLAYYSGSHAEGSSSRAYGPNSHAEGQASYTGLFAYEGTSYGSKVELSYRYDDVRSSFANSVYSIIYHISTDQFLVRQISNTTFTSTITTVNYLTGDIPAGKVYVIVPSNHIPNKADYLFVGVGAHAEGNNTFGLGTNSHAEGYSTNAVGESSHAEGGLGTRGFTTVALGKYSHAEGGGTLSSGELSHAEGDGTRAIGTGSHAEGYSTQASGNYSHAEGDGTLAVGTGSHAEGYRTQASGNYSHAEGDGTLAVGAYSHAQGRETIAYRSYQLALGEYNRDLNNTDLFVIGNGISSANRSDIVNISSTSVRISGSTNISGSLNLVGNQTITGSLFVRGNVTAQQYIISSSVIYVTESNFSGSHVFGNTLDDTHQFTGSVLITGSMNVIGLLTANQVSITGSLFGTSSWALQALTASFVTSSNVWGPFNANSILSASHGVTASYIDGGTF